MLNQQPRVIYLHGFNSSPQSLKAKFFLQYCKQHNIDGVVPQLHYDPRVAIKTAALVVAGSLKASLIIGSSLGGYYATYLAEQLNLKAALINPAVMPFQTIHKAVLGPQQNYYTGEKYEFTQEHIAALQVLAIKKLKRPERFLLLVQTGDEVLDYQDAVNYYQGSAQEIEQGGSHSFDNFAEKLPRIMAFGGIAI